MMATVGIDIVAILVSDRGRAITSVIHEIQSDDGGADGQLC